MVLTFPWSQKALSGCALLPHTGTASLRNLTPGSGAGGGGVQRNWATQLEEVAFLSVCPLGVWAQPMKFCLLTQGGQQSGADG